MTEVLFYHLTERTLDQALPGLVEKSLQKGWNVCIQAGSSERIEALDSLLWTYREDSFLPHSATRDGTEAAQKIWLTSDNDNPNNAEIRFLVDGASIADLSQYSRIVYMFDGHDNSEVEFARSQWKIHKNQEDNELTYWQQKPNGGWEKKA